MEVYEDITNLTDTYKVNSKLLIAVHSNNISHINSILSHTRVIPTIIAKKILYYALITQPSDELLQCLLMDKRILVKDAFNWAVEYCYDKKMYNVLKILYEHPFYVHSGKKYTYTKDDNFSHNWLYVSREQEITNDMVEMLLNIWEAYRNNIWNF